MQTEPLTEAQAALIRTAVEKAEAGTAGEIFVVVAERADEYRLVPVFWGTVAAFVAVWPLHLFTDLNFDLVLALQPLVFAVVAFALSHRTMRTRLVPPWLADEEVERAARDQFLAHGIHLTKDRTGVLIYVARAERRVEIIADDGIAARVDQSEWDEVAEEIVREAREGRLTEGLITAIHHSGRLLAKHFSPAPDDANELPDQLIRI
ncbi:TPM domain-containing protein [Terrihabitans sp. B22-R8]|uniref:TPM domain-containing protein n=1 Tax=Terrihabitans sp. B22-R8 TaxID=3425128 RepID=UPI00403C3DB7